MSNPTYHKEGSSEKPLVWLAGEIKTPPFTTAGRIEAGVLLGRLQNGESLGMPRSRPMPDIGRSCHELRVRDEDCTWRIFYRIDPDAIVILDVLQKKTASTPKTVIDCCKRRLQLYEEAAKKRGTGHHGKI